MATTDSTNSSSPFPTASDLGSTPPTPHATATSPAAPASPANANELVNRVAQSAHSAIDKLAEQAVPHVQRLQDGVQGANEMLHQRADQVTDLSKEWTESLRCTVREHPLAAVGTALAVGLLLARLSR